MPLTKLLADEIRGLHREASASGRVIDKGRVIRLAERAAKSAVPVLIEGEPGTGADALARAIHACSDRKGRPFIRVHVGGLAPRAEKWPHFSAPNDALSLRNEHRMDPKSGPTFGSDALGDTALTTLFGSEKSLTTQQVGKAAEANGGTLLLQNVEELSLEAQKALLRLIQDREIEPTGAKRPIRADIRVIATTGGVSLMERVRQGRFREDLYYRLHVLPITLPPLRARREDIPAMAQIFLAHFAAEEGKPLSGISAAALALLARYDWPGNLRQLENAIFRAVVLAEGKELTVAEFPQIAAQVDGFGVEIPPVRSLRPHTPFREVERIEVRDPHALTLVDEEGELRRLEDLEAEIIRFALAHYRGHMSAVSRRLGIGRSTLYRKLKDLGLENDTADVAA